MTATLSQSVTTEEATSLDAEQALQKLLEGNRRFVTTKFQHPHQTRQWRQSLAMEQHPFAVILGCSDSRVPPEIIFDEGLGDLFVIREAGHVADDATLGSIEFAVGYLQVLLVLVLGHEQCGAVRAAVDALLRQGEVNGHIQRLVEDIRPAVLEVKDQPGDVLDLAVKANVRLVVEQLKTSRPLLEQYVAQGKVRIVGAHYNLHTGEVKLLK
jgi:carbonic anhydrase